jgi:hypothetical protein
VAPLDSPPYDATLRTRFRIWVVVVAAILLGQPAWLVAVRLTAENDTLFEAVVYGGLILLSLPAPVMMRLLDTTPLGAIRLRPATSIFAICLGTLWLQVCSVLVLPPRLIPSHFQLGMINVLVVTLAAILLAVRGRSAWWATVFGWLPLMLIGTFALETAGLAALLAAVSVILGSRPNASERSALATRTPFADETERPEH